MQACVTNYCNISAGLCNKFFRIIRVTENFFACLYIAWSIVVDLVHKPLTVCENQN